MSPKTETLATLIDNLAVQTGAPEVFVGKARESFTTRGVSLDSESGPYFTILIDAFRREESSRRSRERNLEKLGELQEAFATWQQRQVLLIEKLKLIQSQREKGNGTGA